MKFIRYLLSFFVFIILIVPLFIFEKVDELVENYEINQPSIIYDCKGIEIDKIYKNNREICSIDEIPEKMINFIVKIEDKNFFTHRGFDFLRIVKACTVDVLSFSKTQGASSITQQLVKNSFLTQSKTFKRKIKEAFITLEIERKYTKREILEKYLNEIYFGKGIYGIKTASKYFFKKTLDKLSINEMAVLVAIIKIPNGSVDRINLRRKYILRKLFELKIISESDFKNSLEINEFFVKNFSINKIPSFTDVVVSKVAELFTPKQLKEGGLKIYTTLDIEYQKLAQSAVDEDEFLIKNPELECAFVTLDPFNGDVKAILGGRKFLSGYYNRAIRMKRQLGSSFKPIVFLAAIMEGYPLNLVIEDAPLKFESWTPNNYDMNFFGNVTMMEGLYFSRNIVAIKLLKRVGINKIIELSKKIGINSDIPRNLTICLGTFPCSAIEISTAYSSIVNGGYKVEPNFITKIEDKDNNIIFQTFSETERIIDERAASIVLHSLKSNLKSSKFQEGNIKDMEKGGKSGTTNNFKDAWFCAFSNNLVTSVFVGYDDNRTIGENCYGTDVSAPIWKSYMEKLISKGYSPGKFEFSERLLNSNFLKFKSLDSKTGLISKSGRKFLLKRENIPCEESEKYNNGLDFIIKS